MTKSGGGRSGLAHARLAAAVAASLALVCAGPAAAQAPGLEARLQARIDSLALPASVPGITLGVALPDGRVIGLAAGMSDTARGIPMTPAAKMLQGSVGKTYFGAVALQLVGEGRLVLDARVADQLDGVAWFRRLPNARSVTLRQLMTHTSGIVRYETSPGFLADLGADPMRTFTPEQRLRYLFDLEPPFAPGEGWEYSDSNYILVAMLVERATGRPAYDEIRRRYLDPLGLDDTVASDRPDIPGLAQGYAGAGNPFGGSDEMLVGGRLAINPQFEWGGGGFASTAADLARWTREVQEGRAFEARLLDEFRAGPRAPLGPGARYGLGVILLELSSGPAWGHSGFMPGYRTEAYYFPEGAFALALQVNTSAPGALPTPPLRMLDGLAAIALEEIGRR